MRTSGKLAAERAVDDVKAALMEELADREPEVLAGIPGIFKGLQEKALRQEVLERRQRLDGRAFDAVREITCEVGALPENAWLVRLHQR